jgi:voltage-gated potassium channel
MTDLATSQAHAPGPWQIEALRRVRVGLACIAAVIAYGVAGYMLAGWSFGDAVYMVAITITTVGFTEVRPVAGWLRLHTILIIATGYVAVGYTVAVLVAFFAEAEFKRLLGTQRVKRQIEALRGHVVVVGLGRMGTQVCLDLEAAGVPFVVIDRGHDRLVEIERHGWLHVLGDATEEQTLEEAGLRRARALIAAIPDDAVNVFITLTAREIAPDVEIFARAEQPATQRKLQHAGANHVVLPAAIGAQRVVSILTRPAVVRFAELVSHPAMVEIEMEEVEVVEGGRIGHKTLRDLDIGRKTGTVVVAVHRTKGMVEFPPVGTEPLMPGDRLVLLGRRADLDRFRAEYLD